MTGAREREARFRERFAARLRTLQTELSHTNEAMALLAGVDNATWRRWANGETLPKLSHVDRLHRACRVDLNWLLGP